MFFQLKDRNDPTRDEADKAAQRAWEARCMLESIRGATPAEVDAIRRAFKLLADASLAMAEFVSLRDAGPSGCPLIDIL